MIELRFLLKLTRDFDIPIETPVIVGQDNMSTIQLINSTHFNARTRHIALRYHHTGQQQSLGTLRVAHLPTDVMPSDALTKPLDRPLLERHRGVSQGPLRQDCG